MANEIVHKKAEYRQRDADEDTGPDLELMEV